MRKPQSFNTYDSSEFGVSSLRKSKVYVHNTTLRSQNAEQLRENGWLRCSRKPQSFKTDDSSEFGVWSSSKGSRSNKFWRASAPYILYILYIYCIYTVLYIYCIYCIYQSINNSCPILGMANVLNQRLVMKRSYTVKKSLAVKVRYAGTHRLAI